MLARHSKHSRDSYLHPPDQRETKKTPRSVSLPLSTMHCSTTS
uniref:Uncharacterized protein n=1 Tax=Arundo donax TaxID=35708 RepID=A0A0A8XVY8_ARUDO